MSYFSRGKILLAGEYVVLFGAKALAIPTRLGQHLEVRDTAEPGSLKIISRLNENVWFSGVFSIPGFEPILSADEQVSQFVKKIFQAASEMRPDFFTPGRGFELISTLEFDTRWGLGSSSSLISNLARWLDIDPYTLFWKVSPGSGYDIACARATSPLIYQLKGDRPVIRKVDFAPVFKDKLFFVYLGNKQDSQYSVRDFRERIKPDQQVIEDISALSEEMRNADSLVEFSRMLALHEELMAEYLGMEPVKKMRFPGFKGAMKSLGAWGGDLVLVAWEESEEELRKYFDTKGLRLIFRYDDLIGP